MTAVTSVAFVILTLAGAIALARLFRPGSLADRVVAVDTFLSVIVAGIAVLSARIDDGVYLDVLFVTSLVAFVASVTVARFIERRGA